MGVINLYYWPLSAVNMQRKKEKRWKKCTKQHKIICVITLSLSCRTSRHHEFCFEDRKWEDDEEEGTKKKEQGGKKAQDNRKKKDKKRKMFLSGKTYEALCKWLFGLNVSFLKHVTAARPNIYLQLELISPICWCIRRNTFQPCFKCWCCTACSSQATLQLPCRHVWNDTDNNQLIWEVNE